MTTLKQILFLSLLASQTVLAETPICKNALDTHDLHNLIANMPARQRLDNIGSFVPDDRNNTLIDVRSRDNEKLAESVIRKLHVENVQIQNPHLPEVIEASAHLAHKRHALLSVSRDQVDQSPLVRISLDLAKSQSQIVRVPALPIERNDSVPRVDVVVKAGTVSLITGKADAITSEGKTVVDASTSHTWGVEIDGKDAQHPVIDAASANPNWFLGETAQPQFCELLEMANDIARALYPRATQVSFRAKHQLYDFTPGNCN